MEWMLFLSADQQCQCTEKSQSIDPNKITDLIFSSSPSKGCCTLYTNSLAWWLTSNLPQKACTAELLLSILFNWPSIFLELLHIQWTRSP